MEENNNNNNKVLAIVPLMGIRFRPENCKVAIKNLIPGETLLLVREPGNPYDRFAVQVVKPSGAPQIHYLHLGYVPGKVSQIFSTLLTNNIVLTAKVVQVINEKQLSCDIEISLA